MMRNIDYLGFLLRRIEKHAEYDPPMSREEMFRLNPVLLEKLEKDPAHSWRFDTGIELIHREPSLSELERIKANWLLMKRYQKAQSDAKSKELFGMTNLQHYRSLLPFYRNG